MDVAVWWPLFWVGFGVVVIGVITLTVIAVLRYTRKDDRPAPTGRDLDPEAFTD